MADDVQKTTRPCPVIEGLMSVRLTAPDDDHPAIDAAIRELAALRRELRRAGDWDEYHPAYRAGAEAAAWRLRKEATDAG